MEPPGWRNDMPDIMPQARQIYTLTNSRRQELAVCPFREFLKYTLHLQPWTSADPLVFGSLWHELMAAVYRLHAWWDTMPFGLGEPELSPQEAFDTVLGRLEHEVVPAWDGRSCFVQETMGVARSTRIVPIGGVIGAWRREVLARTRPYAGETVPAYDPEKVEEWARLAEAMLWTYLQRWWAPDRERYRVLAVEHRMQSPIRCPSGHPSWQWIYAGDVDLVLQERDGRVVVAVDHKTCSGTPENEEAAQHVSPQVEGYGWLWTEEHPDLPAEAILYRTTRKKEPSTPVRNKCPKRPKDGDHFSCDACGGTGLGPLSESACDTTPAIYETALREAEQAGFPPTEKHRARLQEIVGGWPDRWTAENRRWLRGDDAFDRFCQETWRMCRAKMEMLRGGERGHWRADSPHVCTMFGRPCTYMPLCEQNAPDTLTLWQSSLSYQDTFERRVLTV